MQPTGKTYTINGVPENEGIMYRALRDVMQEIEDKKDISLSISYMEIYNEKIYDLLAITNKVCVDQ